MTDKTDSPNADIDKAIKAMMAPIVKPKKDEAPIPDDIKVKIVNTAINWEKVKHKIQDNESEFDPEKI